MPQPLITTPYSMWTNKVTKLRMQQIKDADEMRGTGLADHTFYQVTPQDLVTYLLKGPGPVTFIDFRDLPAFESSAICQIPGAYRVPVRDKAPYDSTEGLMALKEKLVKQKSWESFKKSSYIVCYCSAGSNRSPLGMINLAYVCSLEETSLAGIGGKIVLLTGGYNNYRILLDGPRVKSTV